MPRKSEQNRASTLAEVAREAGVSIATVSRVLNGENRELWKGAIARADHIRKIAKKFGYRPDWRARALRATKTHSIGVVYSQAWPMMDTVSYMPMFAAFGEIVQPAGYHMMFVHIPKTTGVLPASILQAVDAVVFYHSIGEGEIEASQVIRAPAIQVNCEPKLPYPYIGPDEVGGTRALAKHLIDLGHRRISFLDISESGADFDHVSRLIRERTLREAMAEAGIGEHYVEWHEAWETPSAAIVAKYKQMPASRRPTALVLSYCMNAISLMNEFLRQGIRVPQDVSVATYDDHSLVAEAIVPMTTVAVPMEEIGRTAAGMILGLLHASKSKPTRQLILPERLVVRSSTGPVSKPNEG